MIVCFNCESDKIQCKEWVEVNSGKNCGTATSQGDVEDQWCPECQEHVKFKEKNYESD